MLSMQKVEEADIDKLAQQAAAGDDGSDLLKKNIMKDGDASTDAALAKSKSKGAASASSEEPAAAAKGESAADGPEAEKTAFPILLHEIVSDPKTDDCVHWLACGTRFMISDKKKFAAEVLPRFYGHAKFTSFTRRLKRWSFTRVPSGPFMGAYYNPNFRKGEPELAARVRYDHPVPLSGVAMALNKAKLQALGGGLGGLDANALGLGGLHPLIAAQMGLGGLAGLPQAPGSNPQLDALYGNLAATNPQVALQMAMAQQAMAQPQPAQNQQLLAAMFLNNLQSAPHRSGSNPSLQGSNPNLQQPNASQQPQGPGANATFASMGTLVSASPAGSGANLNAHPLLLQQAQGGNSMTTLEGNNPGAAQAGAAQAGMANATMGGMFAAPQNPAVMNALLQLQAQQQGGAAPAEGGDGKAGPNEEATC